LENIHNFPQASLQPDTTSNSYSNIFSNRNRYPQGYSSNTTCTLEEGAINRTAWSPDGRMIASLNMVLFIALYHPDI
jgi:hypothetical protein